MKIIKTFIIALSVFGVSACSYLDIVPDNVATVDYAFGLRSQAEKYLFTCYSYLRNLASWHNNTGLVTGDEIWFFYTYKQAAYGWPPNTWEIARGNQNIRNTHINIWGGGNSGTSSFQENRECNTLREQNH